MREKNECHGNGKDLRQLFKKEENWDYENDFSTFVRDSTIQLL